MLKKIKIKLIRTWIILSIISANKKITMSTNILKNQKISGGLSDLYINNWKEKKGIRICILYLVFYNFQGLGGDKGFTGLKK